MVASRFTFASQAARCDSLAFANWSKVGCSEAFDSAKFKGAFGHDAIAGGAKQPAVDAGRRIHCHDQLARATFQQLIPTNALGMKLESKAAQQHPL